jgi:uncharacterized membrane protein
MCLPNRRLDPKSRLALGIGNFSLAAGLLMLNSSHPSSQIARNWLHGVGGMLLGISIGVNLMRLIANRRCRARTAQGL